MAFLKEFPYTHDEERNDKRAERAIAQGLLDAGYALRVERFSNAAILFVLPTIAPRQLFK